jgi:hypothetical protein
MKRRIWLVVLLILAAGVLTGYLILNKPHPKAEDQTGIAIKSTELFASFKNDEAAANKKYLNKVIAVSGQLVSSEKNGVGQTVAVLLGDTGDDLLAGGVMCTFRDTDVTLTDHGNVQIKGFCTGYANDVHLSDCVLNQQTENQ